MAFASRQDFMDLATRVDAKFRLHEQQIDNVKEQIELINVSLGSLRGDQGTSLQRIIEASQKLSDDTERSLAEIRTGGDTLYHDTKKKFDDMTNALHATFAEIQQKLYDMEGKTKFGGDKDKSKSYLPLKNLVPKKMDHDVNKWRSWRDDTLDYFDTINTGIKELLKGIIKCKDQEVEDYIVNEAFLKNKEFGDEDSARVWRALKELTEGDARRVVTAGPEGNGYEAWRRLHAHFEPGLACQQGAALNDLSRMILAPAKSPDDTRRLLTEFNVRVRHAEDIIQEPVSEGHKRSVILGFIDPLARQHAVSCHGTGTPVEEFKRRILEFTNAAASPSTATSNGPKPMQIGAVHNSDHILPDLNYQTWDCTNCGMDNEDGVEKYPNEDEDHPVDHLTALKGKGKGSGKGKGDKNCWMCGLPGHVARELRKGGFGYPKGGGKGQGQSSYHPYNPQGQIPFKGKGKGGPKGGCNVCGGPHYARE